MKLRQKISGPEKISKKNHKTKKMIKWFYDTFSPALTSSDYLDDFMKRDPELSKILDYKCDFEGHTFVIILDRKDVPYEEFKNLTFRIIDALGFETYELWECDFDYPESYQNVEKEWALLQQF